MGDLMGIQQFSQQLLALGKKNMLLKSRTWISTLSEVLVPVIVILVLLLVRGLVEAEDVPVVVPSPLPMNAALGSYVSQFRQSRTVTCATPSTLIDMVECGYAIAFVPHRDNSPAVRRVVELLEAFSPKWKKGVQYFTTKDDLISHMKSKTYPGERLRHLTFAVVFNQEDGYNFDYTLMGNWTGRGGDEEGPPRAFNTLEVPATDDLNKGQQSTWRIYVQGTVQFQYLIDNFVVLNRDMPAQDAVTYWLCYINGWALPSHSGADYSNTTCPDLNAILDMQADMQGGAVAIPYWTAFPTPAYTLDPFARLVGVFVGILYILAYIWPVMRIIKSLVQEKEGRIAQGLMIMGTSFSVLWISWLLTYALITLVSAGIITAISANGLFPNSDPGIVFLLFWLMGLAVFTYCFTLSAFFSRATTAASFGAVLFYIPSFLEQAINTSTSTAARAVISLLPTVALAQGATALALMESAGTGATYDTWGTMVEGWSVRYSVNMLFISFLFWMVLGIYFNLVVPQQYGVAKRWYFCCLPSFWLPQCCLTKANKTGRLASIELQSEHQNGDGEQKASVQPIPPGMRDKISVRMRKLRKVFNEKKKKQCCGATGQRRPGAMRPREDGQEVIAVKGLDLDLLEGEIFVLLGANGAGKTTTINMLTGMYPPSEGGDAEVFGRSLQTGMNEIRQMLGMCPQHDILYDLLTVKEHLDLIAQIKGVPSHRRAQEVTEMVSTVGLTEKLNSKTATLSGGQKRKLSVAMALIGGSKVVFLDEPTSGMDPYSRRATWELLKKAKQGRTIILTTHFMDEADYLGNRIAIMGHGELLCCGTSLFLKNYYGVGYNMTITTHTVADQLVQQQQHQQLLLLVQSYVPQASIISQAASELSLRLPFSASIVFADMFDRLDSEKEQGNVSKTNIRSYGISVTTLEEVFFSVENEEHDATTLEHTLNKQSIDTIKQVSESNISAALFETKKSGMDMKKEEGNAALTAVDLSSASKTVEFTPYPSGSKWVSLDPPEPTDKSELAWFLLHVRAMMVKRGHNARRDKRAALCIIVAPCVVFFLGALLTTLGGSQDPPEVLFDPVTQYGKPNIVSYNSWPTGPDGVSPLPPWAADFVSAYPQPPNQPVEIVGRTPLDLSTTLLDTINNNSAEVIRRGAFGFQYDPLAFLPNSTNGSWYLAPFPYSWRAINGNQPESALPEADLVTVAIFFNTSGRDSLPIFLNQFDNLRLQHATDFSPSAKIVARSQAFPLTATLSVLFSSSSSFYLALAFAFIPASYGSYVVKERESKAKHLQLISGVGPTAYWCAHLLWDCVNFLVPLALTIAVAFIFDINALVRDLGPFILIMLLYAPSVACFAYLLSFCFSKSSNAETVIMLVCILVGPVLSIVHIFLSIIESTTLLEKNHLVYIWRIFPPFCFANSVSNLYIRDTSLSGFLSAWDMDVTGWNLVYMSLGVFVYGSGVLLVEYIQRSPKLLNYFISSVSVPLQPFEDDEDVQAEAARIDRAGPAGLQEVVTISHLRKVFAGRLGAPPKAAVHDLSFSIPSGQCFGFLGINGAGKTTTLKMLTGDELPSAGTAWLNGWDILTDQQHIRRVLGYCPQFDALLGNLTARETLFLYARLKGLEERLLPAYVDRMLEKLSLTEYADKPCRGYSGGNKRKLSVGMALIGNPKILFLDEPSTGMDPKSRRFMWELIASSMAGRSVILTTHSMEECEALCGRIGIMVGGRLRCLGTSSHLKNKYSDGYQLDVNVPEEKVDGIVKFLQDSFPHSSLLEQHAGALKLRVAKSMSLGKMFRLVEAQKQALSISEYSISEMSLEQIFIFFAKQQEEEPMPVPGFTM